MRDDNRRNPRPNGAQDKEKRETASKRKVFQRTVILMLAFSI